LSIQSWGRTCSTVSSDLTPTLSAFIAANRSSTGGIVAPVILYAAAAGKGAKFENLRPLGETFR